MKRSMQILLIAVGSLFSVGVCASPVPPRSSLELIRYLSPRVSKCLLYGQPELVRAWLMTSPRSSDEIAVIKRGSVRVDRCFGINSDGSRFVSSYDYTRMRAGIVRAALQTQRNKIPEQVPLEIKASYWHLSDGASSSEALLAHQVSVCLVRKNWTSIRNMILAVDPKFEMSDNYSNKIARREVAAVDIELSKVITGLPDCVPERAKLALARVELRNLLEEAALHAIGMDTLIKVSASGHRKNYHA
jgi:hypothetical protein